MNILEQADKYAEGKANNAITNYTFRIDKLVIFTHNSSNCCIDSKNLINIIKRQGLP